MNEIIEELKMNEIIEELKKYTMDSKASICADASDIYLDVSGINMEKSKSNTFIFDIEVFMALSFMSDDENATREINQCEFNKIIKQISEKRDSFIKSISETTGEMHKSFMLMALNQIPAQYDTRIKQFRYEYFFNYTDIDLDMKTVFLEKFNCNYNDFIDFYYLLIYIFENKKHGDESIIFLVKLSEMYKNVFEALTMTRIEYKNFVKKFSDNDLKNLIFQLNLQYISPIILDQKGYYFSLHHVFGLACTDGVLNKITLNDKGLRDFIGKKVLEKYIYFLHSEIKNCSIYSEKKYKIGKDEILTPDLLVFEGKSLIMYDTKMTVPSLGLRNLNKTEIEKSINIARDNIIQIYSRINDYLDGKFNFEGEKSVDRENVYGVVVQLDDFFISREAIYKAVKSELKIPDGDYEFICSNIKIVNLNEIEEPLVYNISFLQFLVNNKNNRERWFDYKLAYQIYQNNNLKRQTSFDDFINETIKKMEVNIKKLNEY